MCWLRHLFALLLVALVRKTTSDSTFVHGAHELDSRNFDSSIRDGNVWLIEFFAPWCGHCRHFAAEYEAVATILHEENEDGKKGVMVGKVDGDAEKAIASRFSVRGYPSFYLVDGWSVYEFEGSRSRQNLVEFAGGGYKEYQPIPFMFSPTGPMGQFRALLMHAGTISMDVFEWMKTSFGLSPVLTGCILLGGVTLASLILMIVFAILLTPKVKDD